MIKNKILFEELEGISTPKSLLKLAYNRNDISDIELPIKIHDIVKSMEKVKFSNELSFDDWDKSGYIKVNRKGDSKFNDIDIWINSSEVEQRQRFTLAHEVGHLLLDILPNINNGSNESFCDELNRDGAVNSQERRANQFAARLLMPPELVKREIKKIVVQLKKENNRATASKVSEMLGVIFGVSSQAMRFRLQNLGYIKQ